MTNFKKIAIWSHGLTGASVRLLTVTNKIGIVETGLTEERKAEIIKIIEELGTDVEFVQSPSSFEEMYGIPKPEAIKLEPIPEITDFQPPLTRRERRKQERNKRI